MLRLVIVALLSCTITAGCHSKQAGNATLQAQYNQAHKQYYDDCIAPTFGGTNAYMKGEKPKSVAHEEEAAHQQKCLQEGKRVDDLQRQLQAESQ